MHIFDSGDCIDPSIYFAACLKFLKDHAVRTTGCTLEELSGQSDDWARNIAPCPKQGNGTDCGVYTCVNMLCNIFGLELHMSQEVADMTRTKIGVCLMNDCLI